MAVLMSKRVKAPKYGRDPITVYAAGDMALRYGKFDQIGYGDGYNLLANRMNIYLEEEVWDDGYGEYVTTGVENYVFIKVDVTGFTKLIINVKNYNKYADGQCGWGPTPNRGGDFVTPGYSAAADCEFDITGQSAIYIKFYSKEYPLYIYGIRLE